MAVSGRTGKRTDKKAGRRTGGRLWAWSLLLLVTVISGGCQRRGQGETEEEIRAGEAAGKLRVVATVFPYYDFARQIGGDEIELSLIVPAGMDSHSFEPTPADMKKLQSADLIISNGGAMEQWLDQALAALDQGDRTVLTMMDYVDTVQEEIVEGMEEEGHGYGEGHGHAQEPGELEIEYDEHIWTSPVNAEVLAQVIGEELIREDPAHEAVYQQRAASYRESLRKLDAEIRQTVEEGERKLLVFGDKFPLRYFCDEYGLSYRAAFTGCSTDTEPSAKTIAYLIDKVAEEGIPAAYYLELSSPRVAEIIGEETGAEPLLFHSCHNVTRREFDQGVTYLELMERNVENLRKGLQ